MTALLAALLWLAPAQDDDGGLLGLHEAGTRVTIGDLDILFSGILDYEYYVIDEFPSGLLVAEDSFGNPRATFFVDATAGEHVYFFLQARGDRSFDPHATGEDVRADEYFGRYSLWDEGWSASLQVGKFATPLGNFVARHDSMHNPFVRAPLPYDHVTGIGDKALVPGNQALINRRDLDDKVHNWVTMIWGPVYHSGAMLFGSSGDWDLRVAATNAAPSERPYSWDWRRDDQDAYALSARLGWTPMLGLKLGFNSAQGGYLQRNLDDKLRSGRDLGDYPQRLVGIDVEYALGHVTAFAEIYASDWKVPNVSGRPGALAWTAEAKLSLSNLVLPGLYVALRAGQILFGDLENAAGQDTPWDRTTWRLEAAVGWFIRVNLLAKAQYEIDHTNGPNDNDDNVASFSLSFSW